MNIIGERLLTIKAAAKFAAQLLGEDEPLHVSAIYRWISPGIGGVCLEHGRVGGRMVTSREAIQRFSDALTQTKQVEVPISIPKVRRAASADVEERSQRALAEIRAMGVNI